MEENVITKHDETQVKVVSNVDFEFKGLKLPAMVDENHDFWFLLSDVADFMNVNIKSRGQMTRNIDLDEKADMTICQTSSNGVKQKRKVTVITESGFYQIALRSTKKELKEFQRWVRKDIIPSIRKYGIAIYKEQLEQLKPKDLVEVLKQLEPNAEVRIENGTAYICAKDIKDKLGLKSTNAITYRLREDEHFKKFDRIIFVNNAGLKIVIERSRKPEATIVAKLANMEVVKEVPEATVLGEIMKAFGDKFEINDQTCFDFEGKCCKVDLFFPELNLGVEVDEEGHNDRDPDYEKRRQEYMEDVLGWNIIRVNPHDKTFTPADAIRPIFNFIFDFVHNSN